MYLSKLTTDQIKEMIKTMLLTEARNVPYYNKNIPSILNDGLADYKFVNNEGNEYVVAEIKNGDLFVFDDCNYIKFAHPNMVPVSKTLNTNVYLNYMRCLFDDYHEFEIVYNQNVENIVNIVNFCDDILNSRKSNSKKENGVEITY